ncbi:MAG TPA: GNAT family N-acetyltransferase [Stellaceae bacterium]|nr:GNAT family N-acetyltransferase [Stellaceae bacterium]
MISALTWPAEEAAVNGFPPLRKVVLGGWLLRFSEGVRRTANSVTPLCEAAGDALEEAIGAAEALYPAQRLPAIFRIPSFCDAAIDAALAARGYTAEGESCIIAGPLDPVIAAATPFGGIDGVRLEPQPGAAWLAAMARLQGQAPAFAAVYARIVGSLAVPAAFAELAAEGEPAALAYGIVHRGMLCFESVVTAANHRRKGYSRRVLGALAAWAQRRGLGLATLQVEASNTPARTLYHAIGMTQELHRYHYRRQPG